MIKRNKLETVGLESLNQQKLILKNAGLTFIKPKFYRVDTENMGIEQDAINKAKTEESANTAGGKSKFGLPVFDTITFEYLQYTSNDGQEFTVDPFRMDTALVEVTQQRNIVTTSIAGRNGTIKEYIGDGDYIINIKGVIVGLHQNIAPDDIRVLMGFCKSPVDFTVTSNFLAQFDILSMVINYYSFKQIEGQRNVIGFELNGWSDIPVEIREAQDF